MEKKQISEKKFRSAEKKLEGGPFGLAGYGMLLGKQEKPFWFSSLGQIVQFGAIIFCRIFKNYFGQFVWIEMKKKRKVTIIVAFHFMKRRLKTKITWIVLEKVSCWKGDRNFQRGSLSLRSTGNHRCWGCYSNCYLLVCCSSG